MNLNQPDRDELANDLLVGAPAILAYLIYLGMPEDTDPYYQRKKFAQTGIGWPIGKTAGDGGNLIASKRRLRRHAATITNPTNQQKTDAA